MTQDQLDVEFELDGTPSADEWCAGDSLARVLDEADTEWTLIRVGNGEGQYLVRETDE